jgi:UDP-4-amino-4,6-dideoxy-N-acetyl-beta-L-altrosamine transaminase
MKKYLPYGIQTIYKDDIKEVVKVLKSKTITQGKEIESFENKLAQICHAKYAVVVNSGTAALHSAYFAAGLKQGDEIITSPMTFAATANAALYLGAKPIFSDIEELTGNINPDLVEKKITKKAKIIVPIHYSGSPCDMDKISKIAKKYKLIVIEDACHALGAEYKNYSIGSCEFSDMAVLSFHPVKHITTGEGGAVLTNNKKYYDLMREFRTHGITKSNLMNKTKNDSDWYYEMQSLGFNYRLTDFQAALGNSQLAHLALFVKKRRKIAQKYLKLFKDNKYFDTLAIDKFSDPSWHLFPILIKDRFLKQKKIIFDELRKKGIGVQVHYIPVYFHPYYRANGFNKTKCENAEKFYQKEISIPMYPSLSETDQKFVVKTIFSVFNKI